MQDLEEIKNRWEIIEAGVSFSRGYKAHRVKNCVGKGRPRIEIEHEKIGKYD